MNHRILAAAFAASALAAPSFAQRDAPAAPAPVDATVAALRDAALTDDLAYDIVEGLTTEVGQRLAATEAEARARTWAVAKLTALGFKNVHVETYTMPVWLRGVETATVTAPFPHDLKLVALGNSGATPAAGVTLPVVIFKTYGDLANAPAGSLTGKIAYIGNAMEPTQDGSSYGAYGPARFVGPALAASKGAAAVVIRSIGTDHHRNPHTGGTNWPEGVKPIPAAALSVPDAELLERIARRGKPITMHLTLTPRFAGQGTSGNVIADVPGSDPGAGIVLIGGHLDSWDLGTGAIDDASGVAITTAAAKRIMDAGTPRRTIRVVWFGAEEPGGYGGKDYARVHGGEPHAAAGESDFGADRVWRFETNLPDSAKPVGDRLASALAPLGISRGAGVGGDGTDVGPTMALGVAAIDLNQSGIRYFDTHHTPDDVLDRIDPEQLRQNVAAWTAMLAIVANAPEDIGKVTPRK
ncbi:M20/M25/M40 family metallo-hydrolase [Sphingomonas oligophenolica]|uniref:Carboxypeptidase Q n=1 Tax=Sphingomonas oligophenolica TaxID=301154 RepID=A0A502CIC2_9SPHN|nr:M20/M25/M40 family metallo-hydrolase [Sphingomonas oligophenolica]TPG12718.1 peptidase M28 family protein [Sphingomonas oligophenolica]